MYWYIYRKWHISSDNLMEVIISNPDDYGITSINPSGELVSNTTNYSATETGIYLATYLIDNQGSTKYSITDSTNGQRLYSRGGPTAMGSGRYACWFVGAYYLQPGQYISFSHTCAIYKLG